MNKGITQHRAGISFDIQPGEVVKVNYKDANPNQLYSISVRPLYDFSSNDTQNLVTARPFDINTKQVPLIGEVVGLIRGPHGASSLFSPSTEFYYLGSYSVQSQIHHNAVTKVTKSYPKDDSNVANNYNQANLGLPNVHKNKKKSEEKNETRLGESLEEQDRVQPIQPYAGDVIYEGRFGSSIRIGSTVKRGTDRYDVDPTWDVGEGNISDPILILRNGQRPSIDMSRSNKFFVEDVNEEMSSIWLTSRQEVPFKPAYNNFDSATRLGIDTFISQSPKYKGSQIFVQGKDRVILISKEKETIIDSGGGVSVSTKKSVSFDVEDEFEVNAQNRINLGLDSDEPLLLGDTAGDWLSDLLTELTTVLDAMVGETHATGTGPTSPPAQAGIYAGSSSRIKVLQSQIPTLKSLLAYTKRQN